MIVKILLAAFTSVVFGVTFNVRGHNVIWAGLSGGCGYAVYLLIGVGRPLAYFTAALVITLLSEIFARAFRMPATLFLVGGLLPLVPGRTMFQMFQALMDSEQLAALGYLTDTLLQAGALAAGTVIIGALFRIIGLVGKRRRA